MSTPYLVEMVGISKRFGAVVANDRVDLHVRPATLHALVGENGAGKTTLMRILYGYYHPDAGEIRLRGKPVQLRSPADALTHRIGMVSQHYSIIPELSVLDNLMLGAEWTRFGGWLARQAALKRAQSLAASLEFEPPWHRPAAELPPAAAQKLEILKLLWRSADLLILDEPTAMLSPADTQALFSTLKRLKAEGHTILLVTHKLQEVIENADFVTVLRGGRKVAEGAVAGMEVKTLTRWIVGEEEGKEEKGEGEKEETPPTPPTPHPARGTLPHPQAPSLRLEGLWVRSDRGGWGLQDFSLALYPGEIFGLAGVDGNGQVELLEALAGFRPIAKGSIFLEGEPIDRWKAGQRLQKGIRFLYEDRFRRGMVADWSVRDNAILGAQRDPELHRWGWFRMGKVKQRTEQLIEWFGVQVQSLKTPMRYLSGGNQQRLVVARALQGNPRLLVAYAPTRGLDIRGTEATYRAIRSACNAGMTALIISLDLDELMQACDRIGVIYRGHLSQIFKPSEYSREQIGASMIGIPDKAASLSE